MRYTFVLPCPSAGHLPILNAHSRAARKANTHHRSPIILLPTNECASGLLHQPRKKKQPPPPTTESETINSAVGVFSFPFFVRNEGKEAY